MEEYRRRFERDRDSHDCRTHGSFCTFSKYAKFCWGSDESGRLNHGDLDGLKKRGHGLSAKGMTYYIFGACRANASKRVETKRSKSQCGQDHQDLLAYGSGLADPCYSDDDTEEDREQKIDFKLTFYHPYWRKVGWCTDICDRITPYFLQTTKVNLWQAHCLTSRAPTLDL